MRKNKVILVTGAGGFIGSNLTEELVKRGYKVRVLIRRGESKQNISELIQRKKIEAIEGDLLDKASLKKACAGIEFVFHLAAKTDLATKSYRPYFLINVAGTKNLAESCSKNLKRFIFYSSILAEGLPNTRKSLDETYEGHPQHGYGRSKKEAENYLLELYRKNKFPITIIRPTTVYGPKELAVQYYLFKMIKEKKFFLIGSGKNLMSYVYVKNLVDATIDIVFSHKTIGELYFINDEDPYEFGKIVRAIYRVMDRKPPTFYVPFLFAYCGAYIYEIICKTLGIKALIYPSRVKTMVLNYAYSVNKARRDFGYKPKFNLEKGIKETYLWYVKNGYL